MDLPPTPTSSASGCRPRPAAGAGGALGDAERGAREHGPAQDDVAALPRRAHAGGRRDDDRAGAARSARLAGRRAVQALAAAQALTQEVVMRVVFGEDEGRLDWLRACSPTSPRRSTTTAGCASWPLRPTLARTQQAAAGRMGPVENAVLEVGAAAPRGRGGRPPRRRPTAIEARNEDGSPLSEKDPRDEPAARSRTGPPRARWPGSSSASLTTPRSWSGCGRRWAPERVMPTSTR